MKNSGAFVKYMHKIFEVILLLLLTSCAVIPSKTTKEEITEEVNPLIIQDNNRSWKLEAKVGYSDESTSNQAYMIWQQNKDNYTIKIFGLSGELLRLNKEASIYKLRANGNDIVNPPNLTKEIIKKTGLYVPLAQIEYWVKGSAYPYSSSKADFNPQGLLINLEQNNWQISYSEFQNDLARRITAVNPPYKILFVISSWVSINKL